LDPHFLVGDPLDLELERLIRFGKTLLLLLLHGFLHGLEQGVFQLLVQRIPLLFQFLFLFQGGLLLLSVQLAQFSQFDSFFELPDVLGLDLRLEHLDLLIGIFQLFLDI